MNRKQLRFPRPGASFLFGAALLAAAAFASCSSASSSGASYGSDILDFSVSAVQKVDFGSYTNLTLTASGLAGRSLVLAKVNAGSGAVASSATGSAAASSARAANALAQRSVSAGDRPMRKPAPQPLSYRLPASAARTAAELRASGRAASVLYGGTGSYTAGSTTKDFWVDYGTQGSVYVFDKLNAKLAKITDHAYIWVATSGSTVNSKASGFDPASDSAFSAKVNLLADAFEDVVFPGDTGVFGYEYGGGATGNGGYDGDQHIDILLYDIDFDQNSSSDGYVAGYFWSKDEATAFSGIYTVGNSPSNGMEIFYLDAKALSNYPYTIISTLAHEYQHMINYAQEELYGRTTATTWMDESRSLAAEELLAPAFIDFSAAEVSAGSLYSYSYNEDGPGYWQQYFNYYYPATGLTYWNSSVYDYASASVFQGYLLRSYGGVQFMKDELTASNAGESDNDAFLYAITQAKNRSAYTDGTQPATGAALSMGSSNFFASILPYYMKALWGFGADGTAGTSPFTRTGALAAATDSTARYIPALSIRETGSDGKAVADTIYPGLYDIGDKAAIGPYFFSFHSGSALLDIAGSAVLTLTAPSDSDVSYYLLAVDSLPD